MTKRVKWTNIKLPSGGIAHVRSDITPQMIERLDAMLTEGVRRYMAGELSVVGDAEQFGEEEAT